MAQNPFNPDGTWNWQNVSIDEEAAKTTRQAADAWAKAGKKAEEPWNQWQSQKSPEELEAFNQWKRAYVKFNDMATKPGENWFRQEWDRSEEHKWHVRSKSEWFHGKDWLEIMAYEQWKTVHQGRNGLDTEFKLREYWENTGVFDWGASYDSPDAWKELLKQAERNRQQQKQERTWESYGGRNSYRDIFDEWNRQQQQGRQRSGKQLTEELARALILSNLDKFDVHYAEYWQRQRRMQMNEAKSKIGQLSIVSQRTTAEQFKLKMWQSPGSTSSEVDRMYGQVYNEATPVEISDRFAKLLMSPLFQWNR